jgi:hypothetical protein
MLLDLFPMFIRIRSHKTLNDTRDIIEKAIIIGFALHLLLIFEIRNKNCLPVSAMIADLDCAITQWAVS